MKVSDLAQGRVFLISVLVGILCVVLFDIVWVIRKHYGKNVIVVNIFDAIYFLVVFLILFYTGVKYNFGALRYYQMIGILMGMLFQYFVFSSLERKILDKILTLLLKFIRIIFKIIYTPLMFILRIMSTIAELFETKIIKKASKINKTRKKLALKREKNKKTVKKRIQMI
ncbi:MAG: spore cortex biosynthesis protein YabQ [Clostridia bacterium]